MAFNTGNTAPTTNQQNDSWKAQGFLNLYLPDATGKRMKLGAIPLKDSKPSEKQLRAWLEEDGTRVTAILAKLIVEYKSAEPSGNGFDLS